VQVVQARCRALWEDPGILSREDWSSWILRMRPEKILGVSKKRGIEIIGWGNLKQISHEVSAICHFLLIVLEPRDHVI
jgi:hypothetical protein